MQLWDVGKGPMVDPPFEDLCMLGWCLLLADFVSWSLGLWPGPGIACPGLFGTWATSSRGWGCAPMKTFLQAEEAEREERKRLESQREAELKKEEERLRLEEKQKVRPTPDPDSDA